MGTRRNTIGQGILSLCLTAPIALYSYQQNQRPPRQEVDQPLFQGIDYKRLVLDSPRPNVLHITTIDLSIPGVIPIVSSPAPNNNDTQPNKIAIDAQTTSEFVDASGSQIGINGNYFYEFREKTPWDFYPHTGDPVYTVGEAIGSGDRYGSPRQQWPALCFEQSPPSPQSQETSSINKDGHTTYFANIIANGECSSQSQHGIAGRDLLVEDGQALSTFPNVTTDKPYSRAAIGIDQSGQQLWLVIVDGKQPGYSEGMLLEELAHIFVGFGVHGAIALDGGGSSTLVVNPGSGPQLLNTPMHVKWPHQQRPTANHLGFYAPALNHGDND